MSTLEEREFNFLNIIHQEKNLSQRKLSKKLGISLGLTNIILKRLAKKGYIKIQGLDGRKVRYILTPKGFSEKFKRSYYYTLRTISEIAKIKRKIQELILEEYKKGNKDFIIEGKGELADLIEVVFRQLKLQNVSYRRKDKGKDRIYLISDKEKIDILKILSL